MPILVCICEKVYKFKELPDSRFREFTCSNCGRKHLISNYMMSIPVITCQKCKTRMTLKLDENGCMRLPIACSNRKCRSTTYNTSVKRKYNKTVECLSTSLSQ